MSAEAIAVSPGDPRQNAMDRLSRELYAPVLRWASRWTETADDAEDIAQEAMIKLLTRFESFRAQGQIESWMYRITRNAAVSAHRRRSARRRAEGRFEQCSDRVELPDILDRIDARHLAALALAHAEELSPRKRLAFESVCLKGHTAVETGRRLGVAPATIRSLVHRARRQVRAAISCPDGMRDAS